MADINWLGREFIAGYVTAGGFFALLFGVSVGERRLVRPYVPARRRDVATTPLLESANDLPDPSQVSPYVVLMSGHLADAGLHFGGIYAHGKPKIRILATIWWSPARDVLAVTGSGTVFGMASKQSWLFTPLRDGRLLVTTDANDEGDLSGTYVVKRMLNAPMNKLLVAHTRHVQRYGAQVGRFTEPTPGDAVAALYKRRAARMVARGRAYYIDSEHAAYRCTAWGGLLVCLGFFGQLANALTQFWRVNKRPVAPTALSPVGTYPNLFVSSGDARHPAGLHDPMQPQPWH